jgi:hypothetical protein
MVKAGCTGLSDILIQGTTLFAACKTDGKFSFTDLTNGQSTVLGGGGFPISLAS